MSNYKHITSAVCLLLISVCILCTCSASGEGTTYEEVMRVRSPDGRHEAVIISVIGHVLGNNSHLLYIVPAGRKFDKKDSSFTRSYLSIRCFDGLQLIWRDPNILEIQYKEALIDEFRNCANLTEKPDSPYVVELRLAPISTWALPKRCPCLK